MVLGIAFIIDLFMYNQNTSEGEDKQLESIGLLIIVNISPFVCDSGDD